MSLICGLLKFIIKCSLVFFVFATVVVLIPNLPPYTNFSNFVLEKPLPQEGPLAFNGALNNIKKLYNEKVHGPEAFQVFENEVYTSLGTGEIVKLSPGGHVTFVTKIGQPCTGIGQEEKCGRPLGFQIDEKTRQMYVVDTYLGIWKVDLKTDKKQLLVSPRVAISGRVPKIFNSLALAPNGDFYWTDSSSDFLLKDGAYTSMVDPSGRVFHYNAAKNESRVLMDSVWFPNGVVLSPDHQFILVAETVKSRILKHYVEGPNKGTTEVFLAGLPGTPDNMRPLPDGSGVLAALYTASHPEHPNLFRHIAQMPALRKFLVRVVRIVDITFEYLNTQFPNPLFEEAAYNIGSFKSMSGLLPPACGLLHIDWSGRVIASYYNDDRTVLAISDAVVYNDMLYLGAPHLQEFVGAVPAPDALKKAFKQTKQEAPKQKEAPKPVAQEAKVEQKPAAPKVETKPAPKPAEAKPTPAPKPVEAKPTPAPKPAEAKPTPAPKPAEAKPTPAPKPAEPKPTPAPKPTEQKPGEPKPTPAQKPAEPKPTPKPVEAKNTPPPKQAESKPKAAEPAPKAKVEAPQKKEAPKKKEAQPEKKTEGKAPKAIPVEEVIPSDTKMPTPEKLKVIKKEGPTEIPNNL